jgi:hypothetical protein
MQQQLLWYDTAEYSIQWLGYAIFLIVTLLLNLFVFWLVKSSIKLNRTSSGTITKYLCVENSVYSLLCMIQCLLDYDSDRIYMDQIGCNIQAVYHIFFILSLGCTLSISAYNSHRMIRMKSALTNIQLFKFHCLIWTVSLLIGLLSIFIAPSPLMPTSIYCFTNLLNLGQGLVFFIPLCLIICFIIHRYICLYLYIRNSVNEMTSIESVSKESRRQQIIAGKRMFLIVFFYLLTVVPWICTSIYEVSVPDSVLTHAYSFIGISIHLNALFDPIIYILFNSNARRHIFSLFCQRCFYSELQNESQGTVAPKILNTSPIDNRVFPEVNFDITTIKDLKVITTSD